MYWANISQVWWLLITFVWGILNLLSAINVSQLGSDDWTFGQVVAVLSLATPLLTVFEYLYPG